MGIIRCHWVLAPFEFGVDIDFFFHQRSRDDADEDNIRTQLCTRAHRLISTTGADVFEHTVQLFDKMDEPSTSYVMVIKHMENLRAVLLAGENDVEWAQLPTPTSFESTGDTCRDQWLPTVEARDQQLVETILELLMNGEVVGIELAEAELEPQGVKRLPSTVLDTACSVENREVRLFVFQFTNW
jgi:hypothetical protein